MQCPSCGANVEGNRCEYCGTTMPVIEPEPQPTNIENMVVNNFYISDSQVYATNDETEGQQAGVNLNGAVSPKSRLVASLLCFFLGIFGAHRFYVGRPGMGVFFLLTAGGIGIGWLVDMILVLTGCMRDGDGLPVSNWDI